MNAAVAGLWRFYYIARAAFTGRAGFFIEGAAQKYLRTFRLVTIHGHADGPELSRFGVAIFPDYMAVQRLGT